MWNSSPTLTHDNSALTHDNSTLTQNNPTLTHNNPTHTHNNLTQIPNEEGTAFGILIGTAFANDGILIIDNIEIIFLYIVFFL